MSLMINYKVVYTCRLDLYFLLLSVRTLVSTRHTMLEQKLLEEESSSKILSVNVTLSEYVI